MASPGREDFLEHPCSVDGSRPFVGDSVASDSTPAQLMCVAMTASVGLPGSIRVCLPASLAQVCRWHVVRSPRPLVFSSRAFSDDRRRQAREGLGGGFNERQDRASVGTVEVGDDGYDDFGRKKNKARADKKAKEVSGSARGRHRTVCLGDCPLAVHATVKSERYLLGGGGADDAEVPDPGCR